MSIQVTDGESVVVKRSRRRGCSIALGVFSLFLGAYALIFFSDVGPGDDSDLLPPSAPAVPLEENMAYWVGEALEGIGETNLDPVVGAWLCDPKFEPQEFAARSTEVAKFVQANSARFEAIERAARCRVSIASRQFANWTELCSIHRLIAIGVHHRIAEGDRGRAIQLLLSSRYLMKTTGHLSGGVMGEEACIRAWHYLIQTETDPSRLRSLQKHFEDPIFEADWEEQWVKETYRVSKDLWDDPEAARQFLEEVAFYVPEFGLSPLFYRHSRTHAKFADQCRQFLEEAERGEPLRLPAPKAAGWRRSLRVLGGNSAGEILLEIISDSTKFGWDSTRDVLATDRMIQVMIGLQLHQLRTERYPRTLAELVPEFLSEVPRDPDDPQGGPLRWDSDRRVLWSFGRGQADDGGKRSSRSREYSPSWLDDDDRTMSFPP